MSKITQNVQKKKNLQLFIFLPSKYNHCLYLKIFLYKIESQISGDSFILYLFKHCWVPNMLGKHYIPSFSVRGASVSINCLHWPQASDLPKPPKQLRLQGTRHCTQTSQSYSLTHSAISTDVSFSTFSFYSECA